MYKKVIADDGELESLNDKHTLCILLTKGLLNQIESFRGKIFSFNDLDRLEEMVRFCREIGNIMFRVVTETCGIKVRCFDPRQMVFFPFIRQARQFEIHSLLCHMLSMLSKLKSLKYFQSCPKVGILNSFVTTLQPSRLFLDKFLLGNANFHALLPPKPKPQRRYYQKYY